MNYPKELEARLDPLLGDAQKKRMFGGLCYLIGGNMACGVHKEFLIVRLGEDGESALLEPHTRPFDITGKVMKGWVMVEPEGYAGDRLAAWVARARRFAGTLKPK